MIKYDKIFSDRSNRANNIADRIISDIIENDNAVKSVELHYDCLIVSVDYANYLCDMFSRHDPDLPQVLEVLGGKICEYRDVKSSHATFVGYTLYIKIYYYNAIEFKSELDGYRFFAEDYADNEYCVKIKKKLDLNNVFPETKPIWDIINDLENDIDVAGDRARLFYNGRIGMWACAALSDYYEKEGGFRKVDAISANGTTIVILYSDSCLPSIDDDDSLY